MAFSLLLKMYVEYFSASLARQVLLGIQEGLSEVGVSSQIDFQDNNLSLSLSFKNVGGITLSFTWGLIGRALFIFFPAYKVKASNSFASFRMLHLKKEKIASLAILSHNLECKI